MDLNTNENHSTRRATRSRAGSCFVLMQASSSYYVRLRTPTSGLPGEGGLLGPCPTQTVGIWRDALSFNSVRALWLFLTLWHVAIDQPTRCTPRLSANRTDTSKRA